MSAAAEGGIVEKIAEMRPEVEEAVLAAVGNCLTETNLTSGQRTVVSPSVENEWFEWSRSRTHGNLLNW